jgi:hypothetical protein
MAVRLRLGVPSSDLVLRLLPSVRDRHTSALVSSSGPGGPDLPSGRLNGYFSVKHVKTVIFPGAWTPGAPGY